MPTVDKDIADLIIAGKYNDMGDPPVTKIVEYDNKWGGVSYGVVYEDMLQNAYQETEFVRSPRLYWSSAVVVIIKKLQAIYPTFTAPLDVAIVTRSVVYHIEQGWKEQEIIDFLSCTERVNPDMNEFKALQAMFRVTNAVRARLDKE